MALTYPDTLKSANSKGETAFGIVEATNISGHRSVSSLVELYSIPPKILSVSGNNSNNDALGQEWYVVSEGKFYSLTNWSRRKYSDGWSERVTGGGTGNPMGDVLGGGSASLKTSAGVLGGGSAVLGNAENVLVSW